MTDCSLKCMSSTHAAFRCMDDEHEAALMDEVLLHPRTSSGMRVVVSYTAIAGAQRRLALSCSRSRLSTINFSLLTGPD